MPIDDVLRDIATERARQDARWGVQSLPLGLGDASRIEHLRLAETQARKAYERAEKAGQVTHRHIIEEEWCEAKAASTPERQREELVQAAATIVKAIEQLDRDAGR